MYEKLLYMPQVSIINIIINYKLFFFKDDDKRGPGCCGGTMIAAKKKASIAHRMRQNSEII
jgi:hypothetical protein